MGEKPLAMSGTLQDLAASAARLTAPLFAAAGWKWGRGDDEKVPDEADIAAALMHLLERAGSDHTFNNGTVSTGRFSVARWIEEMSTGEEWISVSLEVAAKVVEPRVGAGSEGEDKP